MKNHCMIFMLLVTGSLSSQARFTKDSFFRAGKPFPENYKEIVAGSKWLHIGTYFEYHNKIVVESIDSNIRSSLYLFDDGKHYRKIKGHKIVTNSDFSTINMVYVDASTILQEEVQEKGKKRTKYVIRCLYRKLD